MKHLGKRVCRWTGLPALLILAAALLTGIRVKAQTPYYTWTQGPNGYMVHTQDAYEPDTLLNPGLKSPEDLFCYQGRLYVADTGNARVVVIENGEIAREITSEYFSAPSGLAVTDDYLYVADRGAKEILVFDHQGNLFTRIGKPREKIFGENTAFSPTKISVDKRGNLYVISEGSTSGVMQLSIEGSFLGYFGANRTNTSLMMILQRTFFTQEQLDKLFKNVPSSVTNIAVDDLGLMYTVTQGQNAAEQGQSIRKLSIAGADLISPDVYSSTFADVAVDGNLNIYAIDSYGTIYEYDSYGNPIFAFGYIDSEMQRIGLVSSAAAIDVSEDGKLYVLDQGKGIIQEYRPTDFAVRVHQGLSDYMNGKYAEAEENWRSINQVNTAFLFSYEALAKASFKRQDYGEAMDYYKIAGNVSGYSQSYWYARNEWIEDNLGKAILVLIGVWILIRLVRRLNARKHFLDPVQNAMRRVGEIPFVRQVKLTKMMLKNPFDGYYFIHHEERVGMLTATALYVWLVILQITDLYFTSYMFNQTDPAYVNLASLAGRIILPLLLFVVCNFLVSTISGGEGKFKHVYCGTIYALSPYLLFMLPLQVISNVLTENESFFYQFGYMVILGWCVILLYLMVQEVHVYSVSESVKNICVTVITMLLFLLAGFTLYLLGQQLWQFLVSIGREVSLRV
ncbi:MAG: YIP1 family protein [Butyrivibrio sp.]|nr:YIP1 family protein [Butyrivibrio sp.]